MRLTAFRLWVLAGFAGAIAVNGSVTESRGHDAPSGWTYPIACCSNHDCRPVSETDVRETRTGFVIVATGEVIGFADDRLRHSPDGEIHWCSVGGRDDGGTLCLFVPPRAF